MDFRNISEIYYYIETELFRRIYILHPLWAVHGKIDNVLFREMCSNRVIINLDRNVFQYLLSAVKHGSFDGDWRKELTAFLIWTMLNNYGVAPFTAIREQAYISNDNISGNKAHWCLTPMWSTSRQLKKNLSGF